MLEMLYVTGGSLGSLPCDEVEIDTERVYLCHGQNKALIARYDGWAFILEPGLLSDGTPLRQSSLTIKAATEPDGAPLEAIADGRVVAADEHGFRLKALTTAKAMLCDASGQAGLLSRRGQVWQVFGGVAIESSIILRPAALVVARDLEPLGPRSRLSALAA